MALAADAVALGRTLVQSLPSRNGPTRDLRGPSASFRFQYFPRLSSPAFASEIREFNVSALEKLGNDQ